MKKFSLLSCLIILLGMMSLSFGQDHLLITELAVRLNTPVNGEFVEIYNGTGATVDLTNYYLTDAPFQGDNDYVNIVDGTFTPFSYDFLAKFPDGATIADGQYIIVANKGGDFNTTHGFDPDYELLSQSDTVPDMVAPGIDFISSNNGFTDGSEVMILFYWDGASDLVQDVDYIVWGDTEEATDKTGIKKDGPDADTDSTTYLPDTPYASQILLTSMSSTRLHADGKTIQRKALSEIGETTTGGNGITGHDETSEDLANAFLEADPTPGGPYVSIVNVTFFANTAAVPDTLGPTSVVQIRGAGGPLTWDGNSPTRMENIGGDYWRVTLQFNPGDEAQFKFYTNAHTTIAGGVEWEHQGWEGDVATGNRLLTVGNADTTLPLQFVDGWKGGVGQYEPPFTTNDSTTVVWVRVNMQGWDDFNAASQQIGIRGSNQDDWGQTGELGWGTTYLLKAEADHVNGGSQQYSGRFFYSNAIHVPNKYVGKGLQYKVVVHNAGAPLDEDWGNMVYNSGREDVLTVPGTDTTAYWFWFDNKVPTVVDHKDTVIVEFVADMKNAIDGKGFAFGDTLEVRSGYYGTASGVRAKMMKRQGFSTRYSAIDTVTTTIGAHLDYQFYKIKNAVEYREVYYNFLYTGVTTGEAERRVFDPVASASIKVEDILDSKSEVHRMPLFRNTAVLARDVLVTLACDVRPAIYQVAVGDTLDDIQGNVDISDPAQILQLGVAVNGPITGGWGTWGPGLMTDAARQMFDDGTHGDAVAGDSIFTTQFQFSKDSLDVVGQEFKFGIGGGDNEGGYGNNHIENIDDTNPTFTINAQFGSIEPVSYYTWNFDLRQPTSVKELDRGTIPSEFILEQNYPNPFNPTTDIIYSLPKDAEVTLTVFNTIGQKVATLVSKKQTAGSYQVSWTGRDQNGISLPTGIYFYRLEAGKFTSTRKMLLVK
jgi:hypothetical protein